MLSLTDDTVPPSRVEPYSSPAGVARSVVQALQGGLGILIDADKSVRGGVRIVGLFWLEPDPGRPATREDLTWWREGGYDRGVQPGAAG